MYHYNTTTEPIPLKVYGKSIHKLIQHIRQIKDKAERTSYAQCIIQIMKDLHPNKAQKNESEQKIWDDLFIMADYDLDIDAPYPVPVKHTFQQPIKKLSYGKQPIVFKNYGQNMTALIKQVSTLTDSAQQEEMLIEIIPLVENLYKKNITQEQILEQIQIITGKKLQIDLESVKQKLQNKKNKNTVQKKQ